MGGLRFARFRAITPHEVFALVSHAMLNRHPAAEHLDAFEISLRDRFGVINKPPESINRMFAVHALKDIEKTIDCLIVGGVDAPRPSCFRKLHDNRLESDSMTGFRSGRG